MEARSIENVRNMNSRSPVGSGGKAEDTGETSSTDTEVVSSQPPVGLGTHTGGNESIRIIRVLVHDVRAPLVAHKIRNISVASAVIPNPVQEAPYIPMEIDVEVQLHPLPSVQYEIGGFRRSQRGRSAGALGQGLASILRQERPGAEGGAWLPTAVVGSVRLQVELPCLRVGLGVDASHCGGSWYVAFLGPIAVVQWCLLALAGIVGGSLCICRHRRAMHVENAIVSGGIEYGGDGPTSLLLPLVKDRGSSSGAHGS